MNYRYKIKQQLIGGLLTAAMLMPALALGQAPAPAVYTAPKEAIDKIRQDTDRDNFMGGEAAVNYGLIDKVMERRVDLSTVDAK